MLLQKEYYHKESKGFTETKLYLADAYGGVRRFTLCFTWGIRPGAPHLHRFDIINN